ncbi:calmodulin-like [Dendronephthya gigantea]|uniref:calmodulin-like n=1 Tax=Dendronephthya gigantea TaxID=151771 RepID=UPI00106C2B8B|nr:calmodulin-like [Dendronephthya gigantea]
MSLQLPTGRKGFIGDIGFSFGGAEHDEESEDSEWTVTPILVESVTRGSIAEKAGLEPGDEIIKINAVTVANAARSLPVSLIKNCDKKMRMIVRKGKGVNRTENIVFAKEQIQEFYDAFSLYDHCNKRKILVKDVQHVCRNLGYNETALALDDAISSARMKTGEPDGDKIRWDTFLEAMKQILRHQDIEKDALFAYAAFDPGRKGHFKIRQLRDAFVTGCRATPLEMAEIFRMADPDMDGKVNEQEFLKLLYPYVKMY